MLNEIPQYTSIYSWRRRREPQTKHHPINLQAIGIYGLNITRRKHAVYFDIMMVTPVVTESRLRK